MHLGELKDEDEAEFLLPELEGGVIFLEREQGWFMQGAQSMLMLMLTHFSSDIHLSVSASLFLALDHFELRMKLNLLYSK